jgi:F-type H+-transporting ATPase subunit a
MGLEFLGRVRRTTLWVVAVVSLLTATYASPLQALAVALGAGWSLVNLSLLEHLIVALTGAERGSRSAVRRAAGALLGLLILFVAGAFLLRRLPPAVLMSGFFVPYAVLVLKAATLLLLPSGLWRKLTRDPRLAILAVTLAIGVAWLAFSPLRTQSNPQAQPPVTAAAPGTHEPASPPGQETPGGHEGAAGHEAPAAPGAGPEKFPNFITVLHRAFPNAGWVGFLHHYEVIVFALLIALLLGLVARLATRNAQLIPGGLQNLVEALVEGLDDFITGILGQKHAARYVPFLGTLFIYIWAMNLFGLIPFMESPTSNLNVTVALALTVFVYAQYIGLRGLGLVGYVDHLMGSPRNLTGWLLVPLMLPIHVLGELAKPISLSCRLFGNIFGEDMLLVAFVSLGVTTLSFTHLPFGLPLQLPFLLLALLTSTLQALVFTVLSTIYFLLMLPHDDHEPGHEAEEALLERSPI